MKWLWAVARRVPKFALVFGVITGSTVAFLIWWHFHSLPKSAPVFSPMAEKAKPVDLKSHFGHLILADNELYDVDSGELLAKNWLKDGMPEKIFWDAASNSVLARYEKGFVRYAPDGTELARLVLKYRFAFDNDYKWILFAQDKDIWKSDVDWKEFKLVNQRKLTSIEQFNDANFAGNIILGTEKTLVVRNMNNLLQVNLETGEVHPTRIPLNDIRKRQSPDGKYVVGIQDGEFYCYDLDADQAKSIKIGRGAINDYQWLGNDKCAAIAAMKTVILYDRQKHTLNVVCQLPAPCVKIGEPSPDGRYVFCEGRGAGVLIDLVKNTATPVTGGLGVCWLSNDTFAFSREVPDSTLRGTWIQIVGSSEKRISPEPFLVGKSDDSVMLLKSANLAIFVTKHGLMKMKPDGSEVAELIQLPPPTSHLVGIEIWNN
jgi:hypothetical protein